MAILSGSATVPNAHPELFIDLKFADAFKGKLVEQDNPKVCWGMLVISEVDVGALAVPRGRPV